MRSAFGTLIPITNASSAVQVGGNLNVTGDLTVDGDAPGGGTVIAAGIIRMTNGTATITSRTHGITDAAGAVATFLGETTPNVDDFVVCRINPTSKTLTIKCRDTASNDFVNYMIYD